MRRNEKEITEESAIEGIIRQSLVCRLAVSDGIQPYVVPLCFGYEDGLCISMRLLKATRWI